MRNVLLLFLETIAGELLNTSWNIILKSMQTEYAHATAGTLFNIYWNVYLRNVIRVSGVAIVKRMLPGHCYINGKNSSLFLCWHVLYSIYCIFIAHLLTLWTDHSFRWHTSQNPPRQTDLKGKSCSQTPL